MALYGRSRIAAQVLPLGPCLGAKKDSIQHTYCPERMVHSAGKYMGQLELCICPCHEHKDDEYPEKQRARMDLAEQDARVLSDDADDTVEDPDGSTEETDDPSDSESEKDEEVA